MNKRLLIGLVLLGLSACSPQLSPLPNTGEEQTPAAPSVLANTDWTLVSFGRPGEEIPVIDGSTVTLEFDAQGRVMGSAGCNSYGAHYEVRGSTVSFDNVIRTLMACQQDGVNAQEQRYLQALQATGDFELTGDSLKIWYGNGQGVLNWTRSSDHATATPAASTPAMPTAVPTLGGFPSPVPASRISFQAGATSATLMGNLDPSGSRQYVLRASAGQTLMVVLSFTEGRAILVVWGKDGNVMLSDHAEASRFEGVLPTSQDYYIQLKGSPESATRYSMTVRIPPLPSTQPAGNVERISFQTGETSTAVTGHLAASGSKQYVLSASAGQTMAIDLSFSEGQAILAIWGADGTVLMSDHAEAAYFRGALPSTQDYYILVRGRPDGETAYRMVVTIPPVP